MEERALLTVYTYYSPFNFNLGAENKWLAEQRICGLPRSREPTVQHDPHLVIGGYGAKGKSRNSQVAPLATVFRRGICIRCGGRRAVRWRSLWSQEILMLVWNLEYTSIRNPVRRSNTTLSQPYAENTGNAAILTESMATSEVVNTDQRPRKQPNTHIEADGLNIDTGSDVLNHGVYFKPELRPSHWGGNAPSAIKPGSQPRGLSNFQRLSKGYPHFPLLFPIKRTDPQNN
jgi:hypothetical protein